MLFKLQDIQQDGLHNTQLFRLFLTGHSDDSYFSWPWILQFAGQWRLV